MKRLKAALLAVLVAVLGLMFLTACGAKEGVYKISCARVAEGSEVIEIRVGETYNGVTLTEDFFILELREDGTAFGSRDVMGEPMTSNGTWTENAEDKNKVDITFDGETVTFECDGKTLRGTIDGTEMEFVKQ